VNSAACAKWVLRARGKLRPDRNPASISERLYYQGLIARAFLREGKEPQEYYYLPEEFQRFLQREIGRLASSSLPALPTYTPVGTQSRTIPFWNTPAPCWRLCAPASRPIS
jgi:hypothetical protein